VVNALLSSVDSDLVLISLFCGLSGLVPGVEHYNLFRVHHGVVAYWLDHRSSSKRP
jgi:hypothetical protein